MQRNDFSMEDDPSVKFIPLVQLARVTIME